jgi:hypothetical protein
MVMPVYPKGDRVRETGKPSYVGRSRRREPVRADSSRQGFSQQASRVWSHEVGLRRHPPACHPAPRRAAARPSLGRSRPRRPPRGRPSQSVLQRAVRRRRAAGEASGYGRAVESSPAAGMLRPKRGGRTARRRGRRRGSGPPPSPCFDPGTSRVPDLLATCLIPAWGVRGAWPGGPRPTAGCSRAGGSARA